MAEASRAWGPRMGGNHQCHRAALGGTTRLDGALYSLWTNLKGLWMARSRDRGESWKMWQVLGSDDVLYFPYLVAGPRPNELAGAWFSGKGDAMHAHVALFEMGAGDAPPRTPFCARCVPS